MESGTHRSVHVEYSVLDRHRTMRSFEPSEDSEPLSQLFAYAGRLRENDKQFEVMLFCVMKNDNVYASTLIWRDDQEGQFKLAQLISDNLQASAQITREGFVLKINVKPVFLVIK
ncbi:hypothetical protein MMC10_011338 [Thelotrema lepadinum]|nr:hypothetical protein [Thelotrema lepadinum]